MNAVGLARRHWERIAYAAFGTAGALMSYLLIGASGGDDPYITYWVADRFAATGKIVNYNGDHIEQSSSLAQVVILGVLHAVTRVGVPLLGALLGFASFAGTVFMAGMWARLHSRAAGLVAAATVASAYPLVYWAAGGLETLLVPFFMVWLLLLVHRALAGTEWTRGTHAHVFVVALFASAIRPDALLIVVAVMAAVTATVTLHVRFPRVASRVVPGVDRAGAVRVVTTSACAVVLLELYRLVWFGALMPQPVSAKSGFDFALGRGGKYLVDSVPPAWLALPLLAAFVVGAWGLLRERSLFGWLNIFVAAVWGVLVVGAGGDWMGMARMFIPAFVLMLSVCAVGVVQCGLLMVAVWSTRTSRQARMRPAVVLASLIVALELLACSLLVRNPFYFASNLKSYVPVTSEWKAADVSGGSAVEMTLPDAVPWYERRNYPHLRDAIFLRRLEPWLESFLAERATSEPVTLASVQAGMVPYYVKSRFGGRIRFVDMASLATDDFSRCTSLVRGKYGTLISLDSWAKWAGDCAPPLPDLVLALGSKNEVSIGPRFRVALSQDVAFSNGRWSAPGDLFLAVRDDLAPKS